MEGIGELDQAYQFPEEPFEFELDSVCAPYSNDESCMMPFDASPGSDDTQFDSPSASPNRAVDSSDSSLSFLPVHDEMLMSGVSFPDAMLLDTTPSSVLEFDPPSDPRALPASPQQQQQRGRKRKAPASPNAKVSKVKVESNRVLNKEELQSLSSDDLEEYAAQMQDSPSLTAPEKADVRRHLRLIKNRESAQASRHRKKNYIDDLERKVNQLALENQRLRSNIGNLTSENAQLKTQVVYLRGVVNTTGLGKVLHQAADFLKAAAKNDSAPTLPTTGTIAPVNSRTAGVILMVMLFSFGLLFNTQTGTQSKDMTALPGKSAFHEASNPVRVVDHIDFTPASESRDVLSLLKKEEMPTQRIRQRIEKQRSMPHKSVQQATIQQSGSVPAQIAPIEVAVSAAPSDVHIKEEEPKLQFIPTLQPMISDWKPNTTYLLCPDVQKLTPPPGAVVQDPSAPLQLAFLIPPDSLGPGSDAGEGKEILEVTCQVLDVSVRPMRRNNGLNRQQDQRRLVEVSS